MAKINKVTMNSVEWGRPIMFGIVGIFIWPLLICAVLDLIWTISKNNHPVLRCSKCNGYLGKAPARPIFCQKCGDRLEGYGDSFEESLGK